MCCFFVVEEEDDTPEILFSNGVELTDDQYDRLNAIMMAFGVGVKAVYVHCLSKTDIEHSYLVCILCKPFYFVLLSSHKLSIEPTISFLNNVFAYLLQRIPKAITESIELPTSGVAMLSLHQGNGMQAEFVRCADGRTRFTSGWDHFAMHNDLKPGMDVMMMFYMDNRRRVSIGMHVLF